MEICNRMLCTGCGMCFNICSQNAIQMSTDEYGFIVPIVDKEKCINCGLCQKRCPINNEICKEETTKSIYACWNRNQKIRKSSTSGGVFSLLANYILREDGVVVGVCWNEFFGTEHAVIEREEDLSLIRGSKYVQSNTGDIYIQVKTYLESGKKVLFSGTPCQCHALKLFLNKKYDNLFIVDLVCHGVCSSQILSKYINEIAGDSHKKVQEVNMRCKSPYWDYCNIQIKYNDGEKYSVPTVYDSFFNLFNIGYSLRSSCHECQYTNFKRVSDITLMDFWGFIPKTAKMRDYNKGVSGLLVNSKKGQKMFFLIASSMVYEERTKEEALKTNKSLAEPYRIEEVLLRAFWDDYKNNMSVKELHDKYTVNLFSIPKDIFWRRLKKKYRWLKKK